MPYTPPNYSLIAFTGVFFHPSIGEVLIGGPENGLESLTMAWQTDRNTLDLLPDGTVTARIKPGNMATVTLIVNQDQVVDQALQAWSNAVDVALSLSNVTLALAGKISLTNNATVTQYIGTGVGIAKIPDVSYGDNVPRRTWVLNVARLIHG